MRCDDACCKDFQCAACEKDTKRYWSEVKKYTVFTDNPAPHARAQVVSHSGPRVKNCARGHADVRRVDMFGGRTISGLPSKGPLEIAKCQYTGVPLSEIAAVFAPPSVRATAPPAPEPAAAASSTTQEDVVSPPLLRSCNCASRSCTRCCGIVNDAGRCCQPRPIRRI